MDWQAGDLALCVSYGPDPEDWMADAGGPLRGQIYTVQTAIFYPEDRLNPAGIFLNFPEFKDEFMSEGFVKVTPGTEPIGIEEPRRRILELHND